LNLEKTNGYRSVGEERIKPLVVEKTKGIRSGHFNTIIKDKTGFFIKAMIDEELKVNKESRIRIRLLEDVVIGEQVIPKGKYLYGVVASFKPQRVEMHISSILLGDQIIEVSLDIYDMDGMKGLYVPESQFRELAKSMGSNMASGQQFNIENSPDNQMQLMYGLAKDAFNTTSQTAAKAIRKNKAKLKYSTMVYLVNTKKQNTSSNNQLTL
jgi:conjugative transposon TraM protein